MIHNIQRASATASQFINPWSGTRGLTGVGASGPYLFYLSRAISLYDGCIARATAPGSSAGHRNEYINGTEGGTQTGTDVDLDDPDTSVRSAITGTWNVSAGAGTSSGHHLAFLPIGSPSGTSPVQQTFVYQDASINGLNWYGWGNRTVNLLQGVTATNDRFTTFGIDSSVNATESVVQTPWPLAGTFQYVDMVYSVGTGTGDVTLVLRIDGSDSAITFTLSDTGGIVTLLSDASLTAAVTAGQLVSWRMQQASGTAAFTCVLMCGFVAT